MEASPHFFNRTVASRSSPEASPAKRSLEGQLAVRGLSKRYEDHHAVRDISIDIEPGEFVALLGPSGCGKTTLLRCIAGLVKPTSGDIQIDGKSIVHRAVHERNLGMVFQSYALFPHMTVLDNVAFGLRMRGIGRNEAREQAMDALRMARMQTMALRMPAQLSGGQQQRVALARAVVTRPKVLLLDEPFSALDAKLREAMQIEVRELQRELKITTLLVTHDQSEAMITADRVAVINAGVVEQFDGPSVVYNRPASLFVADFVGRTNRLEGVATDVSKGMVRFRLDGENIEFVAPESTKLVAGQRLTGVLRPERVCLEESSDGSQPRLLGKVREVIFVGEKHTVYVETGCGVVMVDQQNRSQSTDPVLQPGTAVSLEWCPEDMLLFPGE
jgi:spermidine/putrescine ABC transporter ATP-binding subunit